MANNNNNGTPAQLRKERLQRMRAAQEEQQRRHEEQMRSLEQEAERVSEGRREVEEDKEEIRQEQKARRLEKKKQEAEKRRREQEAQAARVADERRLRRLQQPVVGAADDVVDGVSNVFNDSTSGVWTWGLNLRGGSTRSPPTPLPTRELRVMNVDATTKPSASKERR